MLARTRRLRSAREGGVQPAEPFLEDSPHRILITFRIGLSPPSGRGAVADFGSPTVSTRKPMRRTVTRTDRPIGLHIRPENTDLSEPLFQSMWRHFPGPVHGHPPLSTCAQSSTRLADWTEVGENPKIPGKADTKADSIGISGVPEGASQGGIGK